MRLVLDNPLDDLTAVKLHGLRYRRRKVDVPLLAFLSLNELHFGWISHIYLLNLVTLVIQLDNIKAINSQVHQVN